MVFGDIGKSTGYISWKLGTETLICIFLSSLYTLVFNMLYQLYESIVY